jgi:hypothetical protein
MKRSKIKAPVDLLESLVDSGACQFDHHGGCQGHGYISLSHDDVCPQAELKALLDEHYKESNDTTK